jgi:hypothetical protein
MKRKKLTELIQRPLRFHHQDIHQELQDLKRMVIDVTNQVQELRDELRESSYQDELLRLRELYQHPWYKYHGQRSKSR